MDDWQEAAIKEMDRMSDSQLFAHVLNRGDDRWRSRTQDEREKVQWEWNRAITEFKSRMRLS